MNPNTTKRYHLGGENFEISVEIDHAILTEDKLLEINRFWTGAEERIAESDSVLNAVLKMLFNHVQFMAAESNFGVSVASLIRDFAWKDRQGNRKNGQEGWPDMDGSYGIRIVDCWSELFLDDNPRITEVAA